MKTFYCLIALTLFATPLLRAQDSVLPPAIQEGLKTFIDNNAADAAVGIWLKGTPAETDGALRGKISSSLMDLSNVLGKPTGYEVVRQVQISPSVVTTYLVLKFEKGPAFMIADTYNSGKGWIVANIGVNGVMRNIFTEDFIIDLYDQAQKK